MLSADSTEGIMTTELIRSLDRIGSLPIELGTVRPDIRTCADGGAVTADHLRMMSDALAKKARRAALHFDAVAGVPGGAGEMLARFFIPFFCKTGGGVRQIRAVHEEKRARVLLLATHSCMGICHMADSIRRAHDLVRVLVFLRLEWRSDVSERLAELNVDEDCVIGERVLHSLFPDKFKPVRQQIRA